jgi:hypothetical protein
MNPIQIKVKNYINKEQKWEKKTRPAGRPEKLANLVYSQSIVVISVFFGEKKRGVSFVFFEGVFNFIPKY